MELTKEYCSNLMGIALKQAEQAYLAGEVPVGACIVKDQEVLAQAHNLVESNSDATAHAEVLAIQKASKVLGDWRLNGAIMCVTLEPCAMCLGAIKLARVSNLIIASMDPVKGVCGSLFDLTADSRLGPVPKVIYDIEAESSSDLLKRFFKECRQR